MSNKEILEKAIQKAIDGGYSDLVTDGVEVLGIDEFGEYLKLKGKLQGYYDCAIYQLIFNHDFAKAIWDTYPKRVHIVSHGRGKDGNERIEELPMWKYHLQQMVVSDDPIQYLGENIDK